MSEIIINLLTYLAFFAILGIAAWALKNRKAQIKAVLVGLIQQAETAAQQSGLGSDKKKWVLEQLEIAEGKLPGWVDQAIDDLVKELNEKGAWFIKKAEETASGVLDTVTGGGEADG